MVLGLLLVSAIPTTIGACEAISEQEKKINEEKRSAKFNLETICKKGASRRRRQQVDGKRVVLQDGKVGILWVFLEFWAEGRTDTWGQLYIDNESQDSELPSSHPFTGYYFQYPSEEKLEGL